MKFQFPHKRILLSFFLISALYANNAFKPNVILIYTDDVGYGDIGINGGKIPTPHLDKLAGEGVNFTDMHSATSTCTPSRVGMLTGEYPWRKSGNGIAPPLGKLIIDTAAYTLADIFKDAGYHTAVVGKWHLGVGGDESNDKYNKPLKPGPLELGFDESFIIPNTGDRVPCVYVEGHNVVNADPSDPIWVSNNSKSAVAGKNNTTYLHNISDNTYYESDPQHSHTVINNIGRIGYMSGGQSALWDDEDMADDLVARAEQFIINNKEDPFFLFFSTHDIHVPRVPHPRFRGKSQQGWRGDAMVQLDWTVGALREIIEDHSLDSNTLIIFSSDNGQYVADGYRETIGNGNTAFKNGDNLVNGHDAGGPYRGHKYSEYEAGTRVPGIIWGPGMIPSKQSNALMSQMDFMKSFATMLNISIPSNMARDSESHANALFGRDNSTGREVLIEGNNKDPVGMRQGAWKLLLKKNQLYDLDANIAENNNLYNSNSAKVNSMKAVRTTVQNRTYTPTAEPTFTPPTMPLRPASLSQRTENGTLRLFSQNLRSITFEWSHPTAKPEHFHIYNLKGTLLNSLKVTSNTIHWDIETVSPGIYLAEVLIDGQTETLTVLVPSSI